MGARDQKQRVPARVVVVFIAGLVCSVLVSKLMPQIEWAAFLPMGLAVGIIVPDMVALMRGDE
jgi:hypothetical protein